MADAVRFELGEVACWTQLGFGSTRRRCGTIEAVVPPGRTPDLRRHPGVIFDDGHAMPRDVESYVVREGGAARWPHEVIAADAPTPGSPAVLR